jgi:ABC-type Mn2+/Zn2+ transport system permease subunit
MLIGTFIAMHYNLDTGATVVVTAAAFFVLSLFKKKR